MIAAILLAAGQSRRMGAQNKLLLPFGKKKIIEHLVDTLLEVPNLELTVVLGHESERLRTVLAPRSVRTAFNAQHLQGMTSSIQTGVRASAISVDGYLICLSDLPLIRVDEYHRIVEGFQIQLQHNPQCILVPTYQGQKGHPILFSAYYRSHILNHPEPEGCKGIIQAHQKQVYFQSMAMPHILRDMDTPEDYQNLPAVPPSNT
ncbi:MAG: nucleotidyltransferase family protein [Bacteroidota bacterium]